MKWTTVPITIKDARPWLKEWHRRRKTCHAARFAVAVAIDDRLCGVAFVGNPVARHGKGLEVLRLATDGTPNACTRLQSAVDRVARAFGYSMLVTFTDPDEGGASLRAAGWKGPTITAGGDWNTREGRSAGKQPPRWKWTKNLGGAT